MFDIDPLEATFGATVRGVPQAALDDASFRAIHAAGIELGLLIFPGQLLTREQQAAFTLRFGALEFSTTRISDIARDGSFIADPDDDVVKGLRGNEGWHHDSTYMPMQAKGAVFSAEIVPSDGAATGWADIRAAFEALDDDTRERVAQLSAFHSIHYSQGRAGLLPSKRDKNGGYGSYGYHEKEPSLRPAADASGDAVRPDRATPHVAARIAGEPQSELAVSHF